jgi:transcriptional regulator with XRE-family HTH domain
MTQTKKEFSVLSIDQIRERLQDRKLVAVAKRSGVSYRTLINLVKGETKPTYGTLKLLSDYLEGKQYERNQ